jgi:polysaccharide pyruvyl transferase WcaK-like protein
MPDCVFSWRPETPSRNLPRTDSSILAIVLRDVQPLRDFLPGLEQAILRSSEKRLFSAFRVVVQSFEDRLITRQFVGRLQALGLNAALLDTSLEPPSALLTIYGESRATVSTRLHGAIFSTLANTPAIALSADPSKAEGVMSEVGLGDWVLPLDPARADELFYRLLEATQPSTPGKIRVLVELAAHRVESAELQVQSLLKGVHSRSNKVGAP